MRLVWDRVGERFFETGISNGVLYPTTGDGVAWNGLISVTESPSGGDPQPFYLDGYKYQNRAAPEEYEATIEAFTYPDAFEVCMGNAILSPGLFITQQRKKSFGLCYKTALGNDSDGRDHGYKIHLVYNALASPSQKAYKSVSDSPEAINFSWSITTKPIKVAGHKATSHMIVDSTKVSPPLLANLEDILYGSESSSPRLPLPAEVASIFSGWPTLYVTDNGDGTFTVSGPDDVVSTLDPYTFKIVSSTAVDNGDGSFNVTSY